MWRQQLSFTCKEWYILLSRCLTPFLFWSAYPFHHQPSFPPQSSFGYQVCAMEINQNQVKSHETKRQHLRYIDFSKNYNQKKEYCVTCNALSFRKMMSWVPFWKWLQTHFVIGGKIQLLHSFLLLATPHYSWVCTLVFLHMYGLLFSIAEQISQSVGCRLNLLMSVCGVNILLIHFPQKWWNGKQ